MNLQKFCLKSTELRASLNYARSYLAWVSRLVEVHRKIACKHLSQKTTGSKPFGSKQMYPITIQVSLEQTTYSAVFNVLISLQEGPSRPVLECIDLLSDREDSGSSPTEHMVSMPLEDSIATPRR